MLDSLRGSLKLLPYVGKALSVIISSQELGILLRCWFYHYHYPSFWLHCGLLLYAWPFIACHYLVSLIVDPRVAFELMCVVFQTFHSCLLYITSGNKMEDVTQSGFAVSADSAEATATQPQQEAGGALPPAFCERVSRNRYESDRINVTRRSVERLRQYALEHKDEMARKNIPLHYFDEAVARARCLLKDQRGEPSVIPTSATTQDGISQQTAHATEAVSASMRCTVCLENARELMLLPCQHWCLCVDCAKLYASKSLSYPSHNTYKTCPLCRKPVTGTMRVYM